MVKVHRHVVHGRCHLNVSSVMKKAPSDQSVKIVALRHTESSAKMAVASCTYPAQLQSDVQRANIFIL